MDSPNESLPFSVPVTPPEQEAIDSRALEGSGLPIRTDLLYQIAALAAGIILLVTAF